MAKFGNGYGSECHLLRFLGRHREHLNSKVLNAVGYGEQIKWLDFPFNKKNEVWQDTEWKGLNFLRENKSLQAAWRKFWPHGAGIMNWDAVGSIIDGTSEELLLVEAKGNLQEIKSSCAAKQGGGRPKIEAALTKVKQELNVDPSKDWANSYYQYCNRVATLWFLQNQGVPARLLFVYFTGDKGNARRTCPKNKSEWTAALKAQKQHVGLPKEHLLSERIHTIYLPVTG
jgi:hypothetical protein